MTGTITSLLPQRDNTTALAVVDVTAVELLQEGHAATLSGARLDVIRADLLAKRRQLVAMIADLRARPPSGDARIDAVNATLRTEADTGLAYIDLFLEEVESCAARFV